MSAASRSTSGPRRSPAPWLFGLALLLTVLAPLLFLGVWAADGTLGGFLPALVAALVDLAAAAAAAVAGTVVATQRGIAAVRTVVSGHPQGRVGRLAEHQAARWHLARDRFAALRAEWASFEADRYAVARRPALTDVSVPATARFVEAYGDAEFLLTDTEPGGPRRGEFIAAVDRAVAAWDEARRVADELATDTRPTDPLVTDTRPTDARPTDPLVTDTRPTDTRPTDTRPTDTRRAGPAPTRAVDPPRGPGVAAEYTDAADAVRRAARRGVQDLRGRLRA